MKTIIIDDEADARIYLKSLLSFYDEIELLGEAENVAIRKIQTYHS